MSAATKHRLLVVDDEPDLVQSVYDLLRTDYHVLGATRAAEGLRIMERETVHVVMSDQRMPEMTGVQFLQKLRKTHPNTVRLLFTAYTDIDVVTDAINQGNIFGYLTKPWKTQDLHTLLRQATEHYELLAERRRLLDELQETNQQLQKANDELVHANELKKNFIKVASHELRTPLTIILGLSDLGRRAEDLGLALPHLLERIHGSCQRLTDRVDQMMKLLWADQFDRPLETTTIDLAELLAEAVNETREFANQRKQTLSVDLEDNLGTLNADVDKLRDSVEQLLVNAVKFTADGGTIGLSAKRVAGQAVEIRVWDSGIGIEPSELERIFDSFFTTINVSRHSSGTFEFERRGLGLGLSVVKAFVAMHGGRVSVDSTVNQGSAFTIWLPASEEKL